MTGMKEGAGDMPLSGGSTDETSTKQDAETTSTKKLPYRLVRDSVKDDREMTPFYLQDETLDDLNDTVRELEDEFERKVYKTDVKEAIVVAGINGTTPKSVMKQWGYGHD